MSDIKPYIKKEDGKIYVNPDYIELKPDHEKIREEMKKNSQRKTVRVSSKIP